MAKQKTRLLLEIIWDSELDEHPMAWDIPNCLVRDPFTHRGETIRVVSFEDVDEDDRTEQV